MPAAPIGEVSQAATTATRVSLHPCLAIGRGFTGAHCQRAESEKLLSYSLFPRFSGFLNSPPSPRGGKGARMCRLFPEFPRLLSCPRLHFTSVGPVFALDDTATSQAARGPQLRGGAGRCHRAMPLTRVLLTFRESVKVSHKKRCCAFLFRLE